jgi:hypothetical protein
LIQGELPLEEWVAVVRATVPPPARWRPAVRPGFWRRLRERIRSWFTRHGSRQDGYEMFTTAEDGDVTLRLENNREESESAPHHRDGGSVV